MHYLLITALLLISLLIYFRIADRFNIIDRPNERSSHTQITLIGGGIIFYGAALFFFLASGFQYPFFFVGLTLISIVSFLDDILTLSSKIRFAVQLVSILLMFYQLQLFDFPLWLILITVVFGTGIINAYNFMDGINGITVSNSIAVLVLLAICNWQVDFVHPDLIYYTIISCFIFGFFNFRVKAKSFAGDVGSVCIAFIILFFLALLIIKTENIIYILFLLVYGVDSILTIVHRILKKENIFEAHRSHLYQILKNEHQINPLTVSASYGLLQLFFGLGVIYITRFSLELQWIFAVTITMLLGFVYLYLKRSLIKKYQLS